MYKWLNKDSRKFLERGYLDEGETPEQRISDIAETAAKILGEPEFKDRFIHCMENGFFSLSSPIWSNFGKTRGLPISCVTGDSWINTKNDGGKQAKDIVIGDEVLTHKGRYRKVVDVIKTEQKGDIYRLKVSSRMTAINITGNHLVLTNLGWIRVDELDPNNHLVAINGSNGLFYDPIKELALTNKVEDVYDFTVEEDHSFSVSGIVVHNCFGSYIPDSVEGILSKASECGMMSKMGGGTSAFFGDVRGRGSDISTGGKSTGAVHFMELFNSITNVISQGHIRRGSMAAYLPVDHKDIEEFLQIRSDGHPIQDISIGVCISDEWMESMIDGDKQKRSLWGKIIKKRYETGYPYIFFSDNVNNSAPKEYRDNDLKIRASNLCCVTGDQIVPTDKGFFTVYQMFKSKKPRYVVNEFGKKVKASEMKLIAFNQDIYRITISNGMTHRVTGDHKICVANKSGKGIPKTIKCKDLFDDGEYRKYLAVLSPMGKINAISSGKKYTEDISLEMNKDIPPEVLKYSTSDRWKYIDNLLNNWFNTKDRKKIVNGVPASISIRYNGDKNMRLFLEKFQVLLYYTGVLSSLNDTYLVIDDMQSLELMDEKTSVVKNLGVNIQNSRKNDYNRKEQYFCSILKIEKEDLKQSVYCLEVDSDSHLWSCNGFVTHNSEIFLSTSKDESFVCNLSSLNLETWEEWKDTGAVQILTRFLDAVMTEFIDKTDGMPFMDAARNFAVRQRALGIGALGWHSLLQKKGIPFESLEAQFLNKEIFKRIRECADEESKALAVKFGEPELLKGSGRRNATLLAVAPTTSSSFILGQVSPSIEPLNSNYFIKDLAKGKFTFKNHFLKKLLKKKGQDTPEVWRSILTHGGSVQHLDFLDDKEKAVFKTFGEISQKEIVIQASQRQKWIDQGQSLNIMVGENIKPKEVSELMIFAWKNGIKSLYYQRGVNPAQQLARSILNCPSCEG